MSQNCSSVYCTAEYILGSKYGYTKCYMCLFCLCQKSLFNITFLCSSARKWHPHCLEGTAQLQLPRSLILGATTNIQSARLANYWGMAYNTHNFTYCTLLR